MWWNSELYQSSFGFYFLCCLIQTNFLMCYTMLVFILELYHQFSWVLTSLCYFSFLQLSTVVTLECQPTGWGWATISPTTTQWVSSVLLVSPWMLTAPQLLSAPRTAPGMAPNPSVKVKSCRIMWMTIQWWDKCRWWHRLQQRKGWLWKARANDEKTILDTYLNTMAKRNLEIITYRIH